MFRLAAAAALLATLTGPAAAADFQTRREGRNLNSFVQQGPVAAHVLLRSGVDPRILVAFPAGNSGVGLWFAGAGAKAEWSITGEPTPIAQQDGQGRPLHGVRFAATLSTPRIAVKQAVLSSVRVLRDYQGLGTLPDGVATQVRASGDTLDWSRDRLDGAPGYRLSVTVTHGRLSGETVTAAGDGRIGLTVTALTGEAPLHPFSVDALLEPAAARDPQAREALRFLSYHEKFLAGSWRFLTYFGRDTLISLRLLMPALKPEAVESGLRSVLARLSPEGDVAHEEDIGEFAVIDHRKSDHSLSDAPVYDYKMIDSAYLLAPVARAWLLDDARARGRAGAFLDEKQGDRRLGDLVMANLRFVAAHAAPFAEQPRFDRLIALKPGVPVGEWRDSNDGLGGGHYPYDVNAVLVPAALEAGAALEAAGLLDRYATAADKAMLAKLPAMAAIWRERAPALFAMSVDKPQAAIARYAKAIGVPAGPALSATTGAIRYNAIALDGKGAPVPIVHSDEGFALLFGAPSPAALRTATDTVGRPFPAGLMTGVGMLVANPVFAPDDLKARFGANAYHGTVVWSWQQALMAAGLARQLARTDLPAATCRRLGVVQDKLWQAIDASRSISNSELWSWRYGKKGYEIAPFGASGGDADESNAAQLWSTVYLAVQRPQTRGCAQ
jgi:hypothetical protein